MAFPELVDAALNELVATAFAFLLMIFILTLIVLVWIDKHFTLALILIEAAVGIVALTWGKGLVIEAVARFAQNETLMPIAEARISTGQVSTDEMILSVIAIAVLGILALLFMVFKPQQSTPQQSP